MNKKSLQLSLFFCFILWSIAMQAQTTLKGHISNNEGENLENIHILVYSNSKSAIIAFGITNAHGDYKIQLNSQKDSVFVKTQSMTYTSQTQWVRINSPVKDFVLRPEVTELKEVQVKAEGISQRGDTISYRVGAFLTKNDQVIADVIKKLPGLEVEPDGKILYQGKAITKYYIEGLDLLEGKYNLANNNIPANAVASVQVLENHMPIKLLRGVVFSDKASLNIKLKNSITVTGTVRLGTGYSPLLWSANITPMVFNKKQQIIYSYQNNNMGDDVAADLKVLTIEDLIEKLDYDSDKKNLMGIQNLAVPDFESRRYLDNNVHLFSANHLVKINKDVQLKVNTSYLQDKQKHVGALRTAYYLADDTIVLNENINNRIQKKSFVNDIILTKNSDKYYLKNTFNIKAYWDKDGGNITRNSENFSQQYKSPFQNFSNKLSLIKPLGKRMWQINFFIGYKRTPQSLIVSPGQLENILNDGKSYGQVQQDATHSSFFVNNSLALINKLKNWTFTHKLGYQYHCKDLESQIYLLEKDSYKLLNKSFENQQKFDKYKIYANEELQYNTGNLRFSANLQVSNSEYEISDPIAKAFKNKNAFILQPSLTLNYKFASFWEWKNSWRGINNINDRHLSNYAYLLENYRRLQKRDFVLDKTHGQSLNSSIYYKNPLYSLFFHMGYRYSENMKENISSNQLLDNGALLLQWKKYDNTQYNHHLFSYANKYLGDLKTILSVKADCFITKQKIFLNEKINPIENMNIGLGTKIATDVFSWLNVELKSEYSWLRSTVNDGVENRIEQASHKVMIMVFPWEKHYFGATTDYYKNENSKSLFLDFVYRYSFSNKRTKLEFRWINALNESEYSSYSVGEYYSISNHYKLRPSQLQMNLSFSF